MSSDPQSQHLQPFASAIRTSVPHRTARSSWSGPVGWRGYGGVGHCAQVVRWSRDSGSCAASLLGRTVCISRHSTAASALRCHVAPVWLVAILPAITSSSWCVSAGATSARNNPSRGAGSSSATSSVAGPVAGPPPRPNARPSRQRPVDESRDLGGSRRRLPEVVRATSCGVGRALAGLRPESIGKRAGATPAAAVTRTSALVGRCDRDHHSRK
jgi:hypothetical protein